MTMNRGRDIVVVAIVLSVVIHIALMIYARPRVMTHVARGIQKSVRHEVMRIRKAIDRPAPVAARELKDEQAVRKAPEATLSATPLPPEIVKENAEAGSKIAPPSVEVQAMAPVEVVAEKPVFKETVSSDVIKAMKPVPSVPSFKTPTIASVQASAPNVVSAASEVKAPGMDMPLPVISAPSVPLKVIVHAPGDGDTVFVPSAKVYEKVDEQVVKEEKAAVKQLLSSSAAADLAKFADVSAESVRDAKWTYFRICIRPRSGADALRSVPKDFVVLIDASGSIGRDRIGSIRGAAKALLRSATNTGDRFNLVAFRDRYSYAFDSWQDINADSLAASDRWFNNLAPFGRTDVFGTIRSVLTLPRDPKRPLIALVVTDGEANSGISETTAILSAFTKLNDGLVSLYMYGVKESANRDLLESLTECNRGESSVFDGFRWSAGSGIGELTARFRDPVLTDLRLLFTADSRVEAYPVALKNLYAGGKVEIFGRAPATVDKVSFSLSGLNGSDAYEGYFTVPFEVSSDGARIKAEFERGKAAAERISK